MCRVVKPELLTDSGAPESVAESSFAYDAAGNRTFTKAVMSGVIHTKNRFELGKPSSLARIVEGHGGEFA